MRQNSLPWRRSFAKLAIDEVLDVPEMRPYPCEVVHEHRECRLVVVNCQDVNRVQTYCSRGLMDADGHAAAAAE